MGRHMNGNIGGEDRSNGFMCRLVFFGIILMIPIISPGMTMAFSSVALPQMHLNLDEASWFGSVISIARPFGSLCTGFVIDKYGRRASMISVIIPNIIGWFLLADGNASLTQLYVGRLLNGFTVGGCTLPYAIYLAECVTVNDVQMRSSVSAWPCIALTTGFFLVYSLGAMLPYDGVALISACWSTLSLILVVIFIPESPAWLYERGRIGDAEVAQQRLGIKQPILQNRNGTFATLIGVDFKPRRGQGAARYFRKMSSREVYKPLAITVTFMFFAEFSCLNGLVSYMVDVIAVDAVDIDPYVLSVLCGALQVIGCILSTLILPCSGVRILSISSFLGVSAGFLALAFSILFESSSSTEANLFNYLHFVSVWVIMFVGALGVLVIPYSILSELFPAGAKGYAGLSLFACAVFNFTVLKIFPYMFRRHRNVIFFLLSGVCACGAAFVAACLPETVGKTMDEIRNGFDGGEGYEFESRQEHAQVNRNSVLYEKLSRE